MKNMKLLMSILLIFSFSKNTWATETVHLTNGEFEPYLSENLKHYGVASLIVTEAFALEGVKVEYEFFPWKRAYNEAKIGNYDGSVMWTHFPEREKFFYFSDDSVIQGLSVFFHLKSYNFNWETAKDLEGIYVGGTAGYKYALLEKLEKAGKINIDRAQSDTANFVRLLKGYIQIFQIDQTMGYYLLHRYFKPKEIRQITHHPKPIIKDHYHLIISKSIKKGKRLINIFNRGLKKLKESGKYDQLVAASLRGEYQKK